MQYTVGDFVVMIDDHNYDIRGQFSKELLNCLRSGRVEDVFRCLNEVAGARYHPDFVYFAYLFLPFRDSGLMDVLTVLFADDMIEDFYLKQYPQVKLRRFGARFVTRDGREVRLDRGLLQRVVEHIARESGVPFTEDEPLRDLSVGYTVQHRVFAWRRSVGKEFGAVIRRFPLHPPTYLDLIRWGTFGEGERAFELAGFLWWWVAHGLKAFIIGRTGAGKTTFLQGLLTLVPDSRVIVTIEENRELRLWQKSWIPLYTRSFGRREITYVDLLKGALRMRADYVIVGECRWEETNYLITQYMVFGTPAMTTFHADSIERALQRILHKPIAVPPNVVYESVDFFVYLLPVGNRRVVFDIAKPLLKGNELVLRTIYGPPNAPINYDVLGMTKENMKEVKFLAEKLREWVRAGVSEYGEFGRLLNDFYREFPEYMGVSI